MNKTRKIEKILSSFNIIKRILKYKKASGSTKILQDAIRENSRVSLLAGTEESGRQILKEAGAKAFRESKIISWKTLSVENVGDRRPLAIDNYFLQVLVNNVYTVLYNAKKKIERCQKHLSREKHKRKQAENQVKRLRSNIEELKAKIDKIEETDHA